MQGRGRRSGTSCGSWAQPACCSSCRPPQPPEVNSKSPGGAEAAALHQQQQQQQLPPLRRFPAPAACEGLAQRRWLPLPGVGPGGSEQSIPVWRHVFLGGSPGSCWQGRLAAAASDVFLPRELLVVRRRSDEEPTRTSGSQVYKRPSERNPLWTESPWGEGAAFSAPPLQR